MSEKAKKKFQIPHSFVIVFTIIAATVLLTWIVPAGEYVRVENAKGIKVIDPTQFQFLEKTPVNPLLIPMYIVDAFIKRVDLMLVILFSGGAFHMLTQSGSLQAVIAKLAKKFSDNLYVFIPILTLMFGLICTTQAVNMFIAFAPIMVMLSLAIGLDSITGAAIILLGGAIGFSTGTLNPNTTVVAQKIADLPLYSGIGYRWVCFAVYYVITNIALIRYALTIRKDPTKSPMYDLDKEHELKKTGDLDEFGQAAAVMPIMVPLADLIGMTRQTAILAFNFGDGFCNYILPTSTALMGIISACNIPYDRWMRFMWKIFAMWLVVGAVLLVIAQAVHLGPM